MPPATTKIIPNDKLFVSEPNPWWFGNRANPIYDVTWTEENWLKSRFHFSFAEYNNPENVNFGAIQALNDEIIQPKRGFEPHPHVNMEIVTYVVQGQLTHQDDLGETKTPAETLGRGSIQCMTAGTGIVNTEVNLGDKPLRIIRACILPSKTDIPPRNESYHGSLKFRMNKLHHIVGSKNHQNNNDSSTVVDDGGTMEINQDLDVYVSELSLGKTISFNLEGDRQVYLVCIEGQVSVNENILSRYDACEIMSNDTKSSITIKATSTEATETGNVAHIILFSVKDDGDSSRKDLA